MTAECGEQARLGVARTRRLDFLAKRAAGAQQIGLRRDYIVAGIDKGRIECCVLAAGDGQVPAVDEHVEEAVAGVHRAGDGTGRPGCS